MKILLISNLFPPDILGGYEIVCAEVSQGLVQRGHEVCVLTSGNPRGTSDGHDGEVLVRRALELIAPFSERVPVSRARGRVVEQRNRDATARTIDELRPDLIFLWSQLRLTLGPASAAERARVPVAYTLNDINTMAYVPPRLERSIWSAARVVRHHAAGMLWRSTSTRDLAWRHVTCISEHLKQRLIELGVPIDRAEVIYQGIPLSEFPAKAEPGSLHCPLRILYVGALLPYKGVHTILAAGQEVARRAPELRAEVTVVGDGDIEYTRRLHRISASGQARVEFLGRLPRSALSAVYRDHDIFVFASAALEGFGLTHLEAMASGTTVVSTDRGGHAECMRDGSNALLFTDGNELELALRIISLGRSPALSAKLAHHARAMVEADYSLARYIDRIDEFLARAAAGTALGLAQP